MEEENLYHKRVLSCLGLSFTSEGGMYLHAYNGISDYILPGGDTRASQVAKKIIYCPCNKVIQALNTQIINKQQFYNRKNSIVITLLVLAFCTFSGSAQTPAPMLNARISAPSPNAASLGVYGEVPINLSTGQLNYQVPVYELNNHDLSIPISLSYNYQGLRPNEHPSWTGLGWGMTAGGVITRSKRGEIDEYLVRTSTGATCLNGISYMDHTSGRMLLANLQPSVVGTPVTDFNSLLQRQFFTDLNCTTTAFPGNNGKDYLFDSEPDEFHFNFNGITGKFVYNNANNSFVIVTNSSEVFKIEYTTATNLAYSTTITMPRYINKFTITTYSGYKYEFGGNYNDHTMELFLGAPASTFTNGGTAYDKGNCLYVSSWYLSKVTTPQGITADFIYERDGISATIEPAIDLGQIGTAPNIVKSTNYNTYSILLNTTVFLKEISSGNKQVRFTRERTTRRYIASNTHDVYAQDEELPDYPAIIGTTAANVYSNILSAYYGLYGADVVSSDRNLYYTFKNSWQKLVKVEALEGNTSVQSFLFDYYPSRVYNSANENYTLGASSTGRLELKSIQRRGFDYSSYQPYYSFQYYGQGHAANIVAFAPYGTRRVDHWGFYNNTDFFAGKSESALYVTELSGNTYKGSRGAGAGAAYGCLTKITYPTGGTTEIEYEPNNYRKRVAYSVGGGYMEVVNETANQRGGGNRVKAVTHKSNMPGSADVKISYQYTAGATSANSSGVLNSGLPDYTINGFPVAYNNTQTISATSNSTSYLAFSNTAKLPAYFEGNSLIYTTVIENYADQSYKVNEFSNSDVNGYLDHIVRFPGTVGYWPNGLPFQWFVSRACERGKLLKTSFFKQGAATPEKSVLYEYGTDFNNKVNFMKKDGIQLACSTNQYTLRTYLNSYYTYFGNIKKQTEIDYLNGQAVSSIKEFGYDGYGNLRSEATQYDAQVKYLNEFKYIDSYSPSGPGGSSLVQSAYSLANKGQFKYPLEMLNKVVRNGTAYITGGKVFEYAADRPVLQAEYVLEHPEPIISSNYTPLNISGLSVGMDSRYNKQVAVSSFSQPVAYPQTIVTNGALSAIIRDYEQYRMVAGVKNAAYNEVGYSSFEGTYSGAANDVNKGNLGFNAANIIGNDGVTGNKYYNLAGGSIQRDQLVTGKRYTISFWKKNGNPSVNINPPNGWTNGPASNGWQQVMATFVAQQNSLQISGTGWIDEVRIYPEGAFMETYTYDLNNGMTSSCSASSVITRFEYDEYHRLVVERDADGNVIKKTEYGLQVAE